MLRTKFADLRAVLISSESWIFSCICVKKKKTQKTLAERVIGIVCPRTLVHPLAEVITTT